MKVGAIMLRHVQRPNSANHYTNNMLEKSRGPQGLRVPKCRRPHKNCRNPQIDSPRGGVKPKFCGRMICRSWASLGTLPCIARYREITSSAIPPYRAVWEFGCLNLDELGVNIRALSIACALEVPYPLCNRGISAILA